MPTLSELIPLLEFPNESLAVEYKSWLDLENNRDKAKLAKAAIALANHGGGIVVIGMREDTEDGGMLGSHARPEGLSRYSQDLVNSAINRFAGPQFHSELLFALHPNTHTEHAFVCVPGGHAVPILCQRGCDGIVNAGRCYLRKPGPRSEEPNSADEWRELLDRCLRARRDDMLDAIRLIVQGHVPANLPESTIDALNEFREAAISRWQSLIKGLPENDPARMPLGHYEIAFSIQNVEAAPTLADLRRRLDEAGRVRLTGWGPFISLGRQPFEPFPVDGLIEAWLGQDAERHFHTPAHCDFWRAHPDGRLFLQRGYDEDETEKAPPGKVIDVTLPIWRIGEAMLYVARLSVTYGDNPTILTQCRYTGLRNRQLARLTGFGRTIASYCHDDSVYIETSATANEIDNNLAEILHPMLVPLYERFSFFELPMELVIQEVERMRRNRF